MAAVSKPRTGIGGGVYRNTGTHGTPVWAEIGLVKDCTPKFAWEMVEAGVRATKAKLSAKTRIDVGATMNVRADFADAGYQALFDATCDPDDTLDLLILNGKLTDEGAGGVRAAYLVNLPSEPQEIDGIIYDGFEVSPGYSPDGYPSFVTVGANSAITEVAI